jgi:hypothetical protein
VGCCDGDLTLQGLGLLAGQEGYTVAYVVHLDKWILKDIKSGRSSEFDSLDDIQDWLMKTITERELKR